jgi:hypothetical protein
MAERIGLLELRGWKNTGVTWQDNWVRDVDGPHLRGVFSGGRSEIVLE